ncbi:MAG: thiolase family protein, partial [Chloroflexi bacterium]|nr:thiolase family protein [Chloroflexota bacterium]
GGNIPVNTGGGLLSSHHHIDFTGLAEAVIQLRREGGARQIKDAEICLVSGHGGEILGPGMCSLHSTLVLRR